MVVVVVVMRWGSCTVARYWPTASSCLILFPCQTHARSCARQGESGSRGERTHIHAHTCTHLHMWIHRHTLSKFYVLIKHQLRTHSRKYIEPFPGCSSNKSSSIRQSLAELIRLSYLIYRTASLPTGVLSASLSHRLRTPDINRKKSKTENFKERTSGGPFCINGASHSNCKSFFIFLVLFRITFLFLFFTLKKR